MTRTRKLTLGIAVSAAVFFGGAASASAAGLGDLIGTPPPTDERCKVPPALYQVAAIVDPDSLEGCNFFEDPNYHENRREAGLYTDEGVFTTIFG